MKNEGKQPAAKLGAGHMAAMGRMGVKELGSAFVMDGSNIAQPAGELGTFAQPTQGMIAQNMQGRDERDMDRE